MLFQKIELVRQYRFQCVDFRFGRRAGVEHNGEYLFVKLGGDVVEPLLDAIAFEGVWRWTKAGTRHQIRYILQHGWPLGKQFAVAGYKGWHLPLGRNLPKVFAVVRALCR